MKEIDKLVKEKQKIITAKYLDLDNLRIKDAEIDAKVVELRDLKNSFM